jgi:hypothetical protein
VSDKPYEDAAMTTKDLHERLRGIQGCWDQASADLQEVSGGLEAIIMTPGENDLVAIAKHYGRDPKVFAIGMFDAVIMLKALTTVLEMTAPMLKKILRSQSKSVWRNKMRCCIASSTTSRLRISITKVSLAPQSKCRRWRDLGPECPEQSPSD